MRGLASFVSLGALVLCSRGAPRRDRDRLERAGVEVVPVPVRRGRIDIARALEILGARNLRSLLVEGGGRLHGAFVAADAWSRIVLYMAPRILGEGRPWLPDVHYATVSDAPRLWVEEQRRLGVDLLTVLSRVPSKSRA